MLLLALIGIPIILAALKPSKTDDYYWTLYRLEDPDRYTPGQRQFDPGFPVLTQAAVDIFTRAEDAVSQVSGRDATGMLISQIYHRHSEGDWGDLETRDPAGAAEQDQRMDSDNIGLQIKGVHSILGNDVWVSTIFDPAGNNTTFYLLSDD